MNGELSLARILGSDLMMEATAAAAFHKAVVGFAGSKKNLTPGVKSDILSVLTSGYRSKEEQGKMLVARHAYLKWQSEGGEGEPPESAKYDGVAMKYPVAEPGKSKHQSGSAIDISEDSWLNKYMRKQPGWKWYGEEDPVHFEYTGVPIEKKIVNKLKTVN